MIQLYQALDAGATVPITAILKHNAQPEKPINNTRITVTPPSWD